MSTLNPETRAVVEAVLEAIDIPHAATVGEAEKRQAILTERTRALLEELRSIARSGVVELPMAYLGERLAEHPATGYVTYEQAQERLRDRMDWMRAVGQVES